MWLEAPFGNSSVLQPRFVACISVEKFRTAVFESCGMVGLEIYEVVVVDGDPVNDGSPQYVF